MPSAHRPFPLLRRWLPWLAVACAGLGALAAQAQITLRQAAPVADITTPHVRAELLVFAPEGIAAGGSFQAGLRITHQPQWHTYWLNSGDSGLPTRLDWKLPAGLSAGAIDWPLPSKIPVGALANYGYEGTVLLPVTVAVAPDFPAPGAGDTARLQLHAEWLVCRKECIPEQGDFAVDVPLRSSTAGDAAAFEAARAARPAALTGGVHATVEGDALAVSASGLPATAQGAALELFPETPGVLEPSATPQQSWQGGTWRARVALAAQRSESPAVLPMVLVATTADGSRHGWRMEAPVAGPWPPAAAPATVPPALSAALDANRAAAPPPPSSTTPAAWLVALAAALVGGLLLNLMPCVFPVLAVKVVGFARHGTQRQTQRVAGLAYAAGVVLSFVALGALVMALRAAGTQLGWGFQLQSPAVVAGLAALFTLLGLNLAGVFEVGMWAPRGLAGLALRHPAADAFLSGVLAVAIASPCTAPFMGASVGLAIGLPAVQALPLFAAIGVGMALPYVAASWLPAVARALPRPGPWMDVFRRLMAFPMFATVAWLAWVLGQQTGIDGVGTLLALLVTLASVVWSLTLAGRARWALGATTLACLAAVGATLGGNLLHYAPVASTTASTDGRWQPWTPEGVQALHTQGRPVFIDFTAAWCVTCQVNERTTLARADVLAAFEARQVALLRADWTRQDPRITEVLRGLGRSGVPVYLLQAPGKAPLVLTELIGADELKAALETL